MAKEKELEVVTMVHTDESPVQPDYNRVVNLDDEQNEFITFEQVDYPKIQSKHGKWNDWSLTSLLKAGIDPAFAIHTGMNTRLEGVGVIEGISADVEAAFANAESSQKNED